MKHTVSFLCDIVLTMRNNRGGKCREAVKQVVDAHNAQRHVPVYDRVKPNQITRKLYRMKLKRAGRTPQQIIEYDGYNEDEDEDDKDGDDGDDEDEDADEGNDTLVEPLVPLGRLGQPHGTSDRQLTFQKVANSTFKDVILISFQNFIEDQKLDDTYKMIQLTTMFENKGMSQKKAFDAIYLEVLREYKKKYDFVDKCSACTIGAAQTRITRGRLTNCSIGQTTPAAEAEPYIAQLCISKQAVLIMLLHVTR